MELSATASESLTVPASLEEAWALVADVPRSVAHFPGLERLDQTGEADWTWTLEKLGTGKLVFQTCYTCRYALDPAARTVRWTAVGASGDNARVEGMWRLEAAGSGARLQLVNQLTMDIDLPRVLRRPATALLTRENERLIRTYVANLRTTLSGGDGRVR